MAREKQKLRELKKKQTEQKPVMKPGITRQDKPDIAAEQEPGSYYMTEFCPEAVSDMKLIKKSPENYLEINIVKRSRVVDTFAVSIDRKSLTYKDKKYNITEKFIYLLPTKAGYLMPTSFYKEDREEPVGFLNTNKGITGKALSLLYSEQLYATLLFSEDEKYNLFIVILLIGCLIAFAVGCYFVFFHEGGLFGPAYPIYPYIPGNYTGGTP
jgi:hypothetical protein